MKVPTFKTKCNVKLQKSPTNDKDYYLFIEAYPVFDDNDNKPKRKFTFLNRTVRTVIWDTKKTTRGGNHQPKRSVDGVIQCRSKADQQNALFAAQVCANMQDEYNKKALFPQQYKEQQEKLAKDSKLVLDYINENMKKRESTLTEGTMHVWRNFKGKYLEFENGKRISFGDMNRIKINEFITFIANYKSKRGKKLAKNSQIVMIRCLQAILNDAYKDEIISFNPNNAFEMPKGEQTKKEFLTLEELQKLYATDCRNDTVKRMSIFSALTGMRLSDCASITWGNITDGETPSVKFNQVKTKNTVYLPISKEALALCGPRGEENEKVFKGKTIHTSVYCNRIISDWVKKAGIQKNITFHCFRHTFATLQLSNGTDIYTVSKMLGHTSVTTTQIYTQLIDEKKEMAAKAIKFNLNPEKKEK